MSTVGDLNNLSESSIKFDPKIEKGGWIALGILSFIYMMNFMDRQLLSILIELVKRDIAISDTQIGLLTGTLFAIVYSFFTIPVAMLADRAHRVGIIAAGCFIWSIFVGLTGFATSVLFLAVARVGLALGEAAGMAPSLSILSDYFPPKRRVVAVSLLTSAGPLGAMVGTIFGGLLAVQYGWRATFHFAAVIGLIMVPLLLILVREPLRGRFEQVQAPKPGSFKDTISLYLHLPSLRWLAISAGLFGIVANGLFTWTPALLMRSYGVSIRDVAIYYGPVVGLGLIAGNWLSGAFVSWLGARSIRYYAWVPAVAMLLCAPALGLSLSIDSWKLTIFSLFLPIALCNFGIAPTLTLVQNLTPPEVRSTASALLLLVLGLLGIGLGPLLVGVVSDWLQPTMGDDSLRYAIFFSLIPMMLLCVATFYMAGRHLTVDQASAARRVAERGPVGALALSSDR